MKRKKIDSMQMVGNTFLTLLSITSLIPFILLFIASFTDEKTIIRNGYSFFPKKLSLDAYKYLIEKSELIINGYKVTILLTIVGTILSLIVTSLLAYALSRKDLPFRNVFSFIVFFTLLFNGGLVPTYLMYTKAFGIKNTFFGLLIPSLLMNGYNVMIMKSYYQNSIPEAVVESATVDGANKFRIYGSIVLPLSTPIMATVGLFVGIGYWNDWYNGLIYITNPKLFSLQNILNTMITNAQFLATTSLGASSSSNLMSMPTTSVKMAIAAIGVIPLLLAYPFFQKYFVKGITMGSVKG